jgi:superfamily I DNA and/or RNA helicase
VHLPPPQSAAAPRVRKDVADLLARVRDELDGFSRRTRSGPDVITAEFLGHLENSPEVVRQAVIDYTTVYAATCQQAASYRLADAKKGGSLEYDSVLVDEAARCNPLDLFVPMAQARRRIILVGDHRQLPHIVDTSIQRELDLDLSADGESAAHKLAQAIGQSLFERLFRQLQEREKRDGVRRTVTLDKQYRMHPRLGAYVSEQFYPPTEQFSSGFPTERFAHELPGYEHRFAAWVEVPNSREEERPGQSKARSIEAEVIARELKRLIDADAARELTFGVITFYTAQVSELGKHMTAMGLMTPLQHGGFRVADNYRDLRLPDGKVVERLRVGTVDAFQGKEFDVVLLSMVRSNRAVDGTERERRRKYGHLMSPNRLCVSMSRQKSLLVVVGDTGMLAGPHAAEAVGPLVRYFVLCREEGVVHSLNADRTVRVGR